MCFCSLETQKSEQILCNFRTSALATQRGSPRQNLLFSAQIAPSTFCLSPDGVEVPPAALLRKSSQKEKNSDIVAQSAPAVAVLAFCFCSSQLPGFCQQLEASS